MILFGGCNGSLGNKTNSVYSFDLNRLEWDSFPNESRLNRKIDGFKPETRYGHSQITIDDQRVLIIG